MVFTHVGKLNGDKQREDAFFDEVCESLGPMTLFQSCFLFAHWLICACAHWQVWGSLMTANERKHRLLYPLSFFTAMSNILLNNGHQPLESSRPLHPIYYEAYENYKKGTGLWMERESCESTSVTVNEI